jgi:acid stress-induced BolA-like protein IbaG/YrbA
MASQPTVDPDLDQVCQALKGMFRAPDNCRVEVFHSSGPYLRAIVVSDEFENEGAASRQERVWEHLKKSALGPDLLTRLFGVHPYTWKEFREEFQET